VRDSEVLSYLVLGRARDDLVGSQGFDAAADQLAAGVTLSEISPVLEVYLPIDTIDFRSDSDPETVGEITVGKYVTNGIFVSVGRTLGRDPVDTLRVEWQINKHWGIETDAADDQNAGIDLIWKLDF
jgi:autotransporter translocation and assembly factor TamB